MRKIIALGIMLLFLGMTISSSTGLYVEQQSIKPMSFGNILYVGGNGTGNYSKIQDAIDDASNGDTVFVYYGIYYENLFINKSISLISDNKDNTIIDANGNSSAIKIIETNDVIVDGFTLQNSGNDEFENAGIKVDGLTLDGSNRITISNNIMKNNVNGILLGLSYYCNITSNIVHNNSKNGIILHCYCNGNNVTNNLVKDNEQAGIYVQDGIFNDIRNNLIQNSGLMGVYIFAGADGNKICHNKIENQEWGIVIDAGPYGAGLNEIYFNTISNSSECGIYFWDGIANIIKKNNFINNKIHVNFTYTSTAIIANIISLKIILEYAGIIGFTLLQVNKFFYNYWDDHEVSTPKIIKGEQIIFIFLNLIIGVEPKSIISYEWDLFPAREPYDIGV